MKKYFIVINRGPDFELESQNYYIKIPSSDIKGQNCELSTCHIKV